MMNNRNLDRNSVKTLILSVITIGNMSCSMLSSQPDFTAVQLSNVEAAAINENKCVTPINNNAVNIRSGTGTDTPRLDEFEHLSKFKDSEEFEYEIQSEIKPGFSILATGEESNGWKEVQVEVKGWVKADLVEVTQCP